MQYRDNPVDYIAQQETGSGRAVAGLDQEVPGKREAGDSYQKFAGSIWEAAEACREAAESSREVDELCEGVARI